MTDWTEVSGGDPGWDDHLEQLISLGFWHDDAIWLDADLWADGEIWSEA